MISRSTLIEDTIRHIKNVEELYYNAFEGDIFEIAIYLYLRYGELPYELDNEEKIYKLGNILRRCNSLFDESLNDKVEELMSKESE